MDMLRARWNRHKKKRAQLGCLDPCPWVGCANHLIHIASKIWQKTDDEIIDWIASVPETCLRRFISNNPNGARLDEIAEIMGVSRQRVNQIVGEQGYSVQMGVNRLRTKTGAQVLREFL